MSLFEVLSCLDLPGQTAMAVAPHVELKVKATLARLEGRASRQWRNAVAGLETARTVRLEVALEELALLLERIDFSSGKLEDIKAMEFWEHLEASMEFLEALGHNWSNRLGFDCHESYVLVWHVPEGMVGYLAWLALSARSVASVPEEFRYLNARGKLAKLAARLMGVLATHVNEVA